LFSTTFQVAQKHSKGFLKNFLTHPQKAISDQLSAVSAALSAVGTPNGVLTADY